MKDIKSYLEHKRNLISLLIVLLLLAALPAGIYLSQNAQIFKPRAANTPSPLFQLTSDLQGAKNRNDLNAMIDISERRKYLLFQKIESDPEGFLNEATLYQIRDSFPERIRINIEERLESSGKISLTHGDNFETNKNQDHFFFTKSGANSTNTYNLLSPQKLSKDLDGDEVQIIGISLGGSLVARGGDIKPVSDYILDWTDIRQLAHGNKRAVVLLINFSDQSIAQSFSPASINDLFNNGENSVKRFFEKNSYGKFSISADVYGWITIRGISAPSVTKTCEYLNYGDGVYGDDILEWARLGKEQAIASGVNFNNYDHVIFVFAEGADCDMDKAGFVFNRYAPILNELNLPNKLISFHTKFQNYLHPYAHEIGHNISQPHSNGIICALKAIDSFNNCVSNDGGDLLSLMGGFDDRRDVNKAYHFNSVQKYDLEWIPESKLFFPTRDGIYKVYALEYPTTEKHIIFTNPLNPTTRVFSPNHYYIEYRQTDNFTPPGFNPGISVRLGGPYAGIIKSGPRISPLVLDPFARGLSFFDGTLTDGTVIRDEINRVQFKQISHNSQYAEVEVKYSLDPLPNPSSPSPSPTSTTPTKQVSQVSIVGSGTIYGQGALSCSTTEPNCVTVSLNKSSVCSTLGEIKLVQVLSSGNSSGTPGNMDLKTFDLKFTSPSNSSLCSSSIGEGTLDWLVPPSEDSMKAEPTFPGGQQVRLSWERHSRDSKYALVIDASPGYEANCQSPDICMDVSLPEYTFNIREGQPYRWWVHSVYEQPNLNPPQRSVSPASVNKEFKFGTLPTVDATGKNKYPQCNDNSSTLYPVRHKTSKECYYHKTSCINDDIYQLDRSCDFENYGNYIDSEVISISQPSSLLASCTNGALNISWTGGGPSYELRGGMNLTKEQILDGSTWENSHPTSDDIVGRDLTSTSFSQNVGANNQSYTIWIQSKNQSGVASDRVFYPDPVRCSAPPSQTIQKTVSSITVNNQSLDLSGNSLSLTLPSSETNIPMQVSFSNGDSIFTGIRFIYTPPPQSASSLSASCTNGVLTASWPKVDGAINYELRGGKGLTDRPDDNTWENFPESDKIIGRQLTSCNDTTCTYTTSVQPNGSYFLWVHSRTNSGLSDATKLSSPVVCSSSQSNPPPAQPPSSNILQFTKAECRNGTISLSWNGGGPSYELRGGMNLTKNQILDGTWEASHPTSNDLVGRNLTSNSFSKSVGANNQYYTIWIHSRNNAGVLSDRVFYPSQVYCR